jgi:hypothetical protein
MLLISPGTPGVYATRRALLQFSSTLFFTTEEETSLIRRLQEKQRKSSSLCVYYVQHVLYACGHILHYDSSDIVTLRPPIYSKVKLLQLSFVKMFSN